MFFRLLDKLFLQYRLRLRLRIFYYGAGGGASIQKNTEPTGAGATTLI